MNLYVTKFRFWPGRRLSCPETGADPFQFFATVSNRAAVCKLLICVASRASGIPVNTHVTPKDNAFLLVMLCQVVPSSVSLAPVLTASALYACLLHLCTFALAWFALSGPVKIPQPAVLTLCFAIVLQYWVLFALVRRFTERYGRAPRVNPPFPLVGMTADERKLSLAAFGVGIVAALIVGKLAYLS